MSTSPRAHLSTLRSVLCEYLSSMETREVQHLADKLVDLYLYEAK